MITITHELSNKANVTDYLNQMSAIFHNMNLNMLHCTFNICMNESVCMTDIE